MKYITAERRSILINDPYIGMPIIIDNDWNEPCPDCGCRPRLRISPRIRETMVKTADLFDSMYLGSLPLAMAYVPFQRWKTTYSLERALQAGTVFPELDLPFTGGMKK